MNVQKWDSLADCNSDLEQVPRSSHFEFQKSNIQSRPMFNLVSAKSNQSKTFLISITQSYSIANTTIKYFPCHQTDQIRIFFNLFFENSILAFLELFGTDFWWEEHFNCSELGSNNSIIFLKLAFSLTIRALILTNVLLGTVKFHVGLWKLTKNYRM